MWCRLHGRPGWWLFENESEFDWRQSEPVRGIHIHMNGFARRLVLTKRQKATRKCHICIRVLQKTAAIVILFYVHRQTMTLSQGQGNRECMKMSTPTSFVACDEGRLPFHWCHGTDMIDKVTESMTDLSVCVHSCRPLFSSEGELESGEITAIYKQVGTPFFAASIAARRISILKCLRTALRCAFKVTSVSVIFA